MKDPGRVLIIGAGPTGLGAAWRLRELGHSDVEIVEASAGPGGLAASVVDEQGFTWDLGGHVQFSHYRYYDEVLKQCVGGGWLEHERESWIWIRDRFVPYPLQYNIHRLPERECQRAIDGLRSVSEGPSNPAPRHFDEWISRTFGQGLAEIFMRPYNAKVWGYPLDTLDAGWVGERVAIPDLERVLRNVASGRDDVSWGPNNRFLFPRSGGTGRIWRDVAAALPEEQQHYGYRVIGIDVLAHSATIAPRPPVGEATGVAAEPRGTLESGVETALDPTAAPQSLGWDTLISTMPLDLLCAMTPALESISHEHALSLRHSSVHVLGIGLRGPMPEGLAKKCWMYFPEANSPYYRVTVFSHYSPNNAPTQDTWSLMAEVCESPHRHVDHDRLMEQTMAALYEDRLIGSEASVVSQWHRRLEYGYPTPSLGRDAALSAIQPELERHRIFSRGRFGGWRYETSNQDHSFMQGVELADRLCGAGDEVTYFDPARVNAGAFATIAAQSRR